MIVDWDIHHGNSTRSIFADDDRVLYFSAHGLYRYPAFSKEGWDEQAGAAFVGGGGALGKSINCAWTGEGYGDAEYAELWQRLLMPVAREFDPQLVIISAGFDSAAGDEEGYQVTPRGYGHLVSQLQLVAGGRLVVVLEGGYNIPAISHGLHACVATLAGAVEDEKEDPPWPLPQLEAEAMAIGDIERTIEAQRPYWKCLKK